MVVKIEELITSFEKYLDLLSKEDVFIIRDGRIIAKMVRPKDDFDDLVDSLVGIAENSELQSLDEIKDDRLKRQ